MPILYTDNLGAKNIAWPGIKPDGSRFSPEEQATAMGLTPDDWRTITDAEAAEIMAPSLDEVRAAALERLRMRKWAAKDAGIIVNGIAIDTDDKGQATISGAVTNVLMDPTFTARWKTSATNPDGTAVWLEIGKDVIMLLAKAMTAYTEACFAVEADKQAQIAALQSAEDIAAWLETDLDQGWPSQEYNAVPSVSEDGEGGEETDTDEAL